MGIDFQCNGACDAHIKRVVKNGRKKVNRLHSVISNRVNLSAGKLVLLSVVRPTLEYGSEVWEGNKSQAAALEWVERGVFLGAHQRLVMRQLEGIWVWKPYRVGGINLSLSCGISYCS